jgi:hypothetical protein
MFFLPEYPALSGQNAAQARQAGLLTAAECSQQLIYNEIHLIRNGFRWDSSFHCGGISEFGLLHAPRTITGIFPYMAKVLKILRKYLVTAL